MDGGNTQETVAAKRNPIYIDDFVDVARDFEVLKYRFSGDGQWLAPLATVATQDGETLRMRIGPSWASGLVSREVRVTISPPRERDGALVRSLAWVPSEWQSLFPLLDGDIELAPIGSDWCRLSLSAAYTPPFGGFGVRVDRAMLHHVAASTVRSFLNQMASGLEARFDQQSD
ncbi:MAG: hypothetical protein WA786_04540 [Acidimicrobiales bacterium]